MLAPLFNNIPAPLQQLPRWVLWKGAKVPYNAQAINSPASSIDPDTWSGYDLTRSAYEEGGYSGVGFVLNGDGLVAVDLDHCVQDGRPEPNAMNLMERIGVRYIELSPSGTGLRGFGYGERPKRCKGTIAGVHCELYADRRYVTVTGHILRDGPVVALDGFSTVACELSPTEEHRGEQRTTEDDRSHLLFSSVGTAHTIPAHTIPAEQGQRNKRLFELARHLKGINPSATREELRTVVKEWHRLALPAIGSQDFAVSWSDFVRGWDKVAMPAGATLAEVLEGVEADQVPQGIAALEYGPQALLLVRICKRLADHHDPEPLFLGARQAGQLLGMHFTDAAKLLSALVADGVLVRVSKGAGNRASRYRWAWR